MIIEKFHEKSFITRIVFKKENNLRPTFGDVDRQTVIIFLIISLLEHSSEVRLEKNWSGSKKVTFFAQLLFSHFFSGQYLDGI